MLYLLFVICFLFGGALNVSARTVQSIEAAQGEMITAINEDNSGFIWLGTSDGLRVFDGYRFEILQNDPHTRMPEYINSIVKGPSPELFLLLSSDGLFIYNTITSELKLVDERLLGISVNDVFRTETGNWLVATVRGLFIYDDCFNFRNELTVEQGLGSNRLNALEADKEHGVLVAHSNGIDQLELGPGGNYIVKNQISGGNVRFIVIDSADNLWYNVNGTIYAAARSKWLNSVEKKPQHISDNADCVSAAVVDKEVWIGTRGKGIQCYSSYGSEGIFALPPILFDANGSEINNSVLNIFKDSNGYIWVGTINGLHLITTLERPFNSITHETENDNSLSNDVVPSIYIGEDQVVWIGSSYGINELHWTNSDKTTYTITHHLDSSDDANMVSRNRIQMIVPCSDSLFLISTKYELKYFNPVTMQFSQPDNLKEVGTNFKMRYVRSYSYTKGCIFMAFNKGGIGVWKKSTQSFYPIQWKEIEERTCRAIAVDETNALWVSVDGEGVYHLILSKDLLRVEKISHYPRSQFGEQAVTCMTFDSNGTLWAGTFNGLYKLGAKATSFAKQEMHGIGQHLYVSSLTEDFDHNLWISSIEGIYKLTSQGDAFYYEIDGSNDISKLWYIIGHGIDADGRIYLGGTYGLIYFDPSTVRFDRRTLCPHISSVVVEAEEEILLARRMDNNEKNISFSHTAKQISFEFTSLYYPAMSAVRYAYKLDNYDEEWRFTDSENRGAVYNNLPSRKYTLHVRTTNPMGGWSNEEGIYNFHINPSPWFRWYAFVVYAFVLLLIGYAVFVMLKSQLKIRRENSLNYYKIRNIISITGGLRTPLTLLHAPLEYIVKHQSTLSFTEIRHLLEIMQKNVSKMVNQIDNSVNLSQQEFNSSLLVLRSIRIDEITSAVFHSLQSMAEAKNITYNYRQIAPDITLFADSEKIEVIIFNLLQHAITMSPENGLLDFYCSIDNGHSNYKIEITEQSNFSRSELVPLITTSGFTSSAHYNHDVYKRLLKSKYFLMLVASDYTQLHHGHLSINETDEGGTKYVWSIPLGTAQYSDKELNTMNLEPKNDQIVTTASKQNVVPSKQSVDLTFIQNTANLKVTKQNLAEDVPNIIAIDWNIDLLSLMDMQFAGEYRLLNLSYTNHATLIKQLKQQDCSMVIIDIVSKESPVLQLLPKIRREGLLASLPLIIISQCTNEDFEQHCYELGADLVLKKPFDLLYLATRVRNLIKSRSTITTQIKSQLIGNPKKINVLSSDECFLANLMTVVEEHISDENFGVDALSAALNISQSALYRRIVRVTGETPLNFLRTVRLKRAAELLLSQNYIVSDVANMVGFSDQRYFSICFKRMYGQMPKAYSLSQKEQ